MGTKLFIETLLFDWRAWQDLNLQPSGSKPDTLSN